NSYAGNAGLNLLNAIGRPGLPGAVLNNVRQYLIPNGPGTLCQSLPEPTNTGVYGGNAVCAPTSLDFDRSYNHARQYSAEAHIDSSFDGPFNFLLGGIYFDSRDITDFYQRAFLIGANPNNWVRLHNVNTSWGLFGQVSYQATDRLTLTAGGRVSEDTKRTQLL
ncbi:hypothetical protein LTR94_032481, partial [Friedmanniomyces endolithicus]